MSGNKKLYIYTDGAARGNPGEAGAGIYIRNAVGPLVEKSIYLGFTTNNVAEYSAFIFGLKEAQRLGGERIALFSDSELLVKQLKGEYRIKDKKLKILAEKAKSWLNHFRDYELSHIPRNKNKNADLLANKAIDQKNDITTQTDLVAYIESL